jgi:hypothetical protein
MPQRTARKQQSVIMVCKTCGSEDVRLDAWAKWDAASQRWVLGQTFDYAHCNRCDGECSILEKP